MKARYLLLLASGFAAQALAHGGEDHSHDKPAPAAPATAITAAPTETAQRLADGALFVPKPVQRSLGILTAAAVAGDFPQVVELPGRVVADPNAGGRVQAAQAGTLAAGPQGLAVLGQRVKAGQVLAYLIPTLDAGGRADRQSGLADLDAQLAVQEKRLARLQQLEGSVPQKDIEQAKIELGGLKERRSAQGRALSGRIALTAPVAGVVAASQVVVGQVVEAREILFEIVDPRRLAVEALVFGAPPAGGFGAATAESGDAAPRIDLEFVGMGRSLREQALPVMFRVRSAPGAEPPPLAVSQTLKVFAATAARAAGVAIPASAVVRSATNEPLVWVHDAAERFVPRRISVQPLDGERVRVVSGLTGGERVVVRGAQSLVQVR